MLFLNKSKVCGEWINNTVKFGKTLPLDLIREDALISRYCPHNFVFLGTCSILNEIIKGILTFAASSSHPPSLFQRTGFTSSPTHQSLSLSSPVISVSPNQEPFLRPKSITPFPILWRLTDHSFYKNPVGVEERKPDLLCCEALVSWSADIYISFLLSSFPLPYKKKKGKNFILLA